ncbi:MAG: HEAT repeat domain-containing protein [Verrucomicrobiae bacterium]|nr:HEAT repeat domain-containing protein [Verrucomicrobiae bacterium]
MFLIPAFAGFLIANTSSAADFNFGSQTITVPDGFEVELVAGPPLTDRPITADFDEAGNLYVSESSGSNDPAKVQLEKKPHSILKLTDKNGDGIFDSRTVFAEGMMFPEGTLWYRGSLYVSAPPQIWKLTDHDGDGVAEDREVWYDAQTLTGCANDLHGPYLGRDGWIYWCKGAFAEQRLERSGGPEFVTRASHIYRRHPEGGEVEPVLIGGMDNPVDVVFSRTGERFLSCTFFQRPGGGNRDGLIHAIYGGVYGKENGVLDDHPWTGGLMPVLDHLGPAAPCGLELYEGEGFGPEYTGNLFTASFNLHQVTRHELIPDGASFQSKTSVFLKSDNLDFHPTDVFEDADGSLLVVDTGGWYKLCCPTSQMHKPDILGAIYRVRKSGAPRLEDPRGNKINWKTASVSDLVKLLDDVRPFVADRAIDTLALHEKNAVSTLAKITAGQKSGTLQTQNAIWALTRMDAPAARVAVRHALSDSRYEVQQAALHSISVRRDREAQQAVLPLLQSPSVAVRRVAAEALGRIGSGKSVAEILNAAGNKDVLNDRVLRHSLSYALIEIGDTGSVLAGLDSTHPGTLQATLWTLISKSDSVPSNASGKVIRLIRNADASVREVAWKLINQYPSWADSVIAVVKTNVNNFAVDSPIVLDCRTGLAHMANVPAVSGFVSDCLQNDFYRDFGVAVLQTAEIENPPAAWLDYIDESLGSKDESIVAAALETVEIWAGESEETGKRMERFARPLNQLAESSDRRTALRMSAVSLLSGIKALNLTSPVFEFLLDVLNPAVDPLIRNQAVRVLTSSKLNDGRLADLAEILGNVGPMELGKLLVAYNGDSNPEVGRKLVQALENSAATVTLDRTTVSSALAAYPQSINNLAETAVYPRLSRGGEAAAAELEALLNSLPEEGDVRRGQRIFQSPKVACATCHAIGYVGGDLGPELSSVGKIRSKRDLLEAIVHPSASFVRSYEPVILTKNDGTVLSGIIKDEGNEELLLAVGPGANLTVPRNEVKDIGPSPVSLMPPGMNFVLNKQELADLLAYLQSRRGNWE